MAFQDSSTTSSAGQDLFNAGWTTFGQDFFTDRWAPPGQDFYTDGFNDAGLDFFTTTPGQDFTYGWTTPGQDPLINATDPGPAVPATQLLLGESSSGDGQGHAAQHQQSTAECKQDSTCSSLNLSGFSDLFKELSELESYDDLRMKEEDGLIEQPQEGPSLFEALTELGFDGEAIKGETCNNMHSTAYLLSIGLNIV